jgi:phage shock protein E
MIMKRGILLMCILGVSLLIGCANKDEVQDMPATEYKKITAEEAKIIIDEEDVIILDVRTQAEYDEGHIENAILLPDTEIEDKAEMVLTDKDAKILVYCRSGNRSATSAQTLIEMGYTNVYDFGGIIDWPYEVQ